MKSAMPSLQLLVAATGLSLLSACPVAVFPSTSLYKENPLTFGFPLTFEAQWSPDGKSIALLGLPGHAERYNTPQIYFIDAQSLQLKQSWKIHNPAQISQAWNAPPALSWSPDSSRIHFFQSGGNTLTVDRLFLHSLTPGSSQIETRMWNLPLKFNNLNFIGFSGPVLAPDQRSVALLEKKSATDPEIEKWLNDNPDNVTYSELYALKTFNLDTETLALNHPVFKSVDYKQPYPFWGPDMGSVYLPHATNFNSPEFQQHQPSQLWTLSEVKGTQKRNVLQPKDVYVQNQLLSPDGEHLAVNLESSPVVGHWGVDFENPLETWISPDSRKPNLHESSESLSMIIQLKTGKITWFSAQTKVWNLFFWHGPKQVLGRNRESKTQRDWVLWDIEHPNTSVEYTRPEQPNTKEGQPLAMAAFPKKQVILTLYSPCCKPENLQTGVYLWDLDKHSLTRIGPSITQLQTDFPGVTLYEHSPYDNSYIREKALG